MDSENLAHKYLSSVETKSSTSYVQVGYTPLHETDGKFSSIYCLKNERITWFGLSKSNLYKSSGFTFCNQYLMQKN